MFKLNFDVPSDPIVNVQTTQNRGFTPDEACRTLCRKAD